MVDYKNMVKALRLSWLKRIIDDSCSGFWKLYLNDLLSSNGGLFVFNCNYAVDKLNISNFFYYELLLWWSELRDLVDCDGEYKYIMWNNTEIRSTVKVCFINDTYHKVLSIPKIYFMMRQILTLVTFLEKSL